eukprot:TRINITY_DN11381_c0_g1_i1.p1 TRINITY_DN11381_c0_g1~~TRINITY_DN11381_c0_g1_i1.p1  ORF type:complete len:559 (-),score=92.47 TRINITY_DN11381_c0_g1_i1:44-1720(-)
MVQMNICRLKLFWWIMLAELSVAQITAQGLEFGSGIQAHETLWTAAHFIGAGATASGCLPTPFSNAPSEAHLATIPVNQLEYRKTVTTQHSQYAGFMSMSFKGAFSSGLASGSATFQALSSLSMSDDSFLCMYLRRWRHSVRRVPTLTQLQFSAHARNVLVSQGTMAFNQMFGTHFVAGFTLDSELVAKVVVTASSSSARHKLEASAKASWTTGSVSGHFASESLKADSGSRLEILATGYGMSADNQRISPEGLDAAGEALAKATGPARLFAILVPYTALAEFAELSEPNALAAMEYKRANAINSMYFQLQFLLQQTADAISSRPHVANQLRDLKNAIQTSLTQVEALARGSGGDLPPGSLADDYSAKLKILLAIEPPNVYRYTFKPESGKHATKLELSGVGIKEWVGVRMGNTMHLKRVEFVEHKSALVQSALHNAISDLSFWRTPGTPDLHLAKCTLPICKFEKNSENPDRFDLTFPDATGFAFTVEVEGDLHGGVGVTGRHGRTMRVVNLQVSSTHVVFETSIHNCLDELWVDVVGDYAPKWHSNTTWKFESEKR